MLPALIGFASVCICGWFFICQWPKAGMDFDSACENSFNAILSEIDFAPNGLELMRIFEEDIEQFTNEYKGNCAKADEYRLILCRRLDQRRDELRENRMTYKMAK